MEWVYAIAAVSSALAAVLAWVAKLMWAKEFREAKDETIKAKEAQIELLKNEIQNLRDLSPMKLREYFTSVKQQLEEYNDSLQKELAENSERVAELQKSGEDREVEIRQLLNEKVSLENKIQNLEGIVEDDFISQLIRQSYFGFQLKLRGTNGHIDTFIQRAAGLANYKSVVFQPYGNDFIVDLRYSQSVPKEMIENLATQSGLQVISIQSSRGMTF